MADEGQAAGDPLLALFRRVATRFLDGGLLPRSPAEEPQLLLPPGAQLLADSHVLVDKAREGDQIMVLSQGGSWHHGILVGLRPDARGLERHFVVDVGGGETARVATVSLRPFQDFVAGKVGFARARYTAGGALPRCTSRALALVLADAARQHGFQFDARADDCERFATLCRVGRGGGGCARAHAALHAGLTALRPAMMLPPPARGFKD